MDNIYPTPGERIFEQLNNILLDDAGTIETLRPANQQAFGEAELLQREREREAERQSFSVYGMLLRNEPITSIFRQIERRIYKLDLTFMKLARHSAM